MKKYKFLTTVTPFSKFLAIVLFITFPIMFFYFGFNLGLNYDSRYMMMGQKDGQYCTMEAKLCPDGSYVGRSGSNCDFAACPGISPTLTPTCTPRPKCLDSKPRCMIPETENMCPPSSSR